MHLDGTIANPVVLVNWKEMPKDNMYNLMG